MSLPFSFTFSRCCKNVSHPRLYTEMGVDFFQIRSFVQKFYQFIEGVSQHHRDIDELLGKVRQLPRQYHVYPQPMPYSRSTSS